MASIVVLFAVIAVFLAYENISTKTTYEGDKITGMAAGKFCFFDRQCNDHNPCTADKCSFRGCLNTPEVCPAGYVCKNGQCVSITTSSCEKFYGYNSYEKGYIIYADKYGVKSSHQDECVSNSVLLEKYCYLYGMNWEIGTNQITCAYGCSNGACLNKPIGTCSKMYNIYEFGYVTYEVNYDVGDAHLYYDYKDYCKTENVLAEPYCSIKNGYWEVITDEVDCPNGCMNGACNRPSLCKESDGGDHYKYGYVTYGSTDYYDYCKGEDVLAETSCSDRNGYWEVITDEVNCPNGYRCSDGACVKTCKPKCDGKKCGSSDGCGGTCDGYCDNVIREECSLDATKVLNVTEKYVCTLGRDKKYRCTYDGKSSTDLETCDKGSVCEEGAQGSECVDNYCYCSGWDVKSEECATGYNATCYSRYACRCV